jgi:septum formation protein
VRIILASNSPRRRELLAALGLEFEVLASDGIDESRFLDDEPGSLETRLQSLALAKGHSAAQSNPDAVVISADTVVVLDGEVFGKPADNAQAREMLARLSCRTHCVYTSVAVQCHGRSQQEIGVDSTAVSFQTLSDDRISAYVAREEVFDKAGAYAIQGLGALLVREIQGDYTTVVGLPVGLTASLLSRFGIEVL